MSELGDALELLHHAGSGVQSLESRWSVWRNEARVGAAFTAERKPGSVAFSAVGEMPDETLSEIAHWFVAPGLVREEARNGAELTSLVVRRDAHWWAYTPHMGAVTNDGSESSSWGDQVIERLISPRTVIGQLDLETAGVGIRAGRPVIVLRGVLAEPRDRFDSFHLHSLTFGCPEVVLEVDREHGTLLRVEALFKGEPAVVHEVIEITYNTPVDDERFTFVSPDGEAPAGTDEMPHPRLGVPLHEAASEVAFPVYCLERLPEHWELGVMLHPGRTRPLIPASVHLNYRTADGTGQLHVASMAAGTDERLDEDLREIVHRDRRLLVRESTEAPRFAGVHLTVGETDIVLSSQTLPADKLIELTDRLVIAPDGPPHI